MVEVTGGKPGTFGRRIQQMVGFDGFDVLAKTIHGVKELLLQKQHSRPGIIQNVSEFSRRKPHIQWKQDGASFQNAVIGFEKPVAIQAQECNPVTTLYAGGSQSTGQASNAICQLRVRKSEISTHDRGLVGKLLLRVAEEPNGCEGNVHRLSRYQAD